ncbi:MAG: hypothetical protein QOJ12_1430, partial [Thermoleophilales bacterium]|nr:hypothetical protein [Thermoleophilales bacterium]
MNLESPLTGVVVEVVAEGSAVSEGAPVLVLESMKMHQEVTAPIGGVVRDVAIAVGDQVHDGQVVLRIEAGDSHGGDVAEASADQRPSDLDHVRDDLREALERRAKTLDAARPDAVAKRHDAGRRTARENVDDLVDAGTFVEYGGLAIAAQRGRRELDELIDRTPADGIVTGIGEVNGQRCVALAYDYTVLAGTQG